jgi:hypothetical protein
VPSCKEELVIATTSPARTRTRGIYKSKPPPAATAKVTPKKEEAKDFCVPASGEWSGTQCVSIIDSFHVTSHLKRNQVTFLMITHYCFLVSTNCMLLGMANI